MSGKEVDSRREVQGCREGFSVLLVVEFANKDELWAFKHCNIETCACVVNCNAGVCGMCE